MESILLSIKPEYIERILDGTKKFEFRKRLACKPVTKIYMYSTAPTMQIVGEVQIIETKSAPPSVLWEHTKQFAGISFDKYGEYFKDCRIAHAYELGNVKRYDPPKKLSEFNIVQPPRTFVYLTEGQFHEETT